MATAARRLLLPILVLVCGGVVVAGVFHFGRQNQREVTRLRKEIETLNASQLAMRKDMGELRELLRRPASQPPAPREIVLTLGNAPFKGNANAAVTLVEFTDYECGFCARHVKETMPQLERDYIATGKVKYVFRNFPLESIHKQSFKAHIAATCAGEQGKFWEMHDRLFANQTALAPAQMLGHAQALGLDAARFQACFDGAVQSDQIRKDIVEGQKAGVTATPAFFLGYTSGDGTTLKVVKSLVGAKAYPMFKEEIDTLLAGAPKS